MTTEGTDRSSLAVWNRLGTPLRLAANAAVIAASASSCSLVGGEPPLGRGERGDNAYVPADVFEAIEVLDRELPRRTRSQLREADEEDLILFHLGLGMGLRNDWGLWRESRLAQYFQSVGVGDPDEMSSVILIAYHRHMHGREIRLEELLEHARIERASEPSDLR